MQSGIKIQKFHDKMSTNKVLGKVQILIHHEGQSWKRKFVLLLIGEGSLQKAAPS